MMVISLVFVSVFLFSKKISEDQTMINVVVLVILFFLLQLVFVMMYKKGVKTWAFWLLILLGLIGIAGAGTTWYFFQLGKAFLH